MAHEVLHWDCLSGRWGRFVLVVESLHLFDTSVDFHLLAVQSSCLAHSFDTSVGFHSLVERSSCLGYFVVAILETPYCSASPVETKEVRQEFCSSSFC